MCNWRSIHSGVLCFFSDILQILFYLNGLHLYNVVEYKNREV
jgi:hypothetical protein